MFRTIRLGIPPTVFVAALLLAGCNGSNAPSPQAVPPANIKGASEGATPTTPGDEEHGHKPGKFGGIIVSIGKDSYHAEAIFEKGGKVRLLTLAKDESTILEVESQPLTAFVKGDGDADASSFVLRPEPQAGDKQGMTSQFLGQLPSEYIGKRVEVTIPTLKIGAERFRIGFKNSVEVHAAADMPVKVADEEEKKLYLTAGGIYTEADIKANGNMTASQKFKGFKARHDLKPAPGDKICPVTLTKANPLCTWIIAGKSYEFCCPPCVDEFVATAKESPADIKEPEAYRKK